MCMSQKITMYKKHMHTSVWNFKSHQTYIKKQWSQLCHLHLTICCFIVYYSIIGRIETFSYHCGRKSRIIQFETSILTRNTIPNHIQVCSNWNVHSSLCRSCLFQVKQMECSFDWSFRRNEIIDMKLGKFVLAWNNA